MYVHAHAHASCAPRGPSERDAVCRSSGVGCDGRAAKAARCRREHPNMGAPVRRECEHMYMHMHAVHAHARCRREHLCDASAERIAK